MSRCKTHNYPGPFSATARRLKSPVYLVYDYGHAVVPSEGHDAVVPSVRSLVHQAGHWNGGTVQSEGQWWNSLDTPTIEPRDTLNGTWHLRMAPMTTTTAAEQTWDFIDPPGRKMERPIDNYVHQLQACAHCKYSLHLQNSKTPASYATTDPSPSPKHSSDLRGRCDRRRRRRLTMPVEGHVVLDERFELVAVLDDEVHRLAPMDLVVAGAACELVGQRPKQTVAVGSTAKR